MKMAAARAIAKIVQDMELREDYIIPSVFNRDVAPAVAEAVAAVARSTGMAATDENTIGFAAIDEQRMRPTTV
jgi:malate dehydrogenase (oxaloacetate-decarboxylating)